MQAEIEVAVTHRIVPVGDDCGECVAGVILVVFHKILAVVYRYYISVFRVDKELAVLVKTGVAIEEELAEFRSLSKAYIGTAAITEILIG